ncbi:MAG: hypothetical protein CVU05_04345 [Bacteroidetes bacterium HGW-Bacteroidetes-21]|nr:MAG: hypothetical protein CVU05_04345 [Bacteroidetes bacterium HGW-Bacteroidetes-21]
MNPLFYLLGICLLACNSVQPPKTEAENILSQDTMECSALYPFDNYYIDLNENNAVLIDGIPAIDFKKCSKYAHRFVNPISDSVLCNGRTFVVEKNKEKGIYIMHIYEGQKRLNTVQLPVENPLPEVHEYYFNLLPYKNDVIMMMEDMYTTHFVICKYNAEGKELMRKEIEHTFVTHPEPNTNYHHRYLYFYNLTATQMIFSSSIGFAEKAKTLVLSMDDFSTTEFDITASGLILDENDENLAGFVSKDNDKYLVRLLNNEKYEFEIKNGDPACDFILKDKLLFIANYHSIATGSSLYCFDLQTRKMKWTADVKQVNASHSEYSNKVTLSMFKGKIIMEGDEASGKYVQLFDSKTGKRLAVFGSFMNE